MNFPYLKLNVKEEFCFILSLTPVSIMKNNLEIISFYAQNSLICVQVIKNSKLLRKISLFSIFAAIRAYKRSFFMQKISQLKIMQS